MFIYVPCDLGQQKCKYLRLFHVTASQDFSCVSVVCFCGMSKKSQTCFQLKMCIYSSADSLIHFSKILFEWYLIIFKYTQLNTF